MKRSPADRGEQAVEEILRTCWKIQLLLKGLKEDRKEILKVIASLESRQVRASEKIQKLQEVLNAERVEVLRSSFRLLPGGQLQKGTQA
jgi:cytoplasmic iron level regulating protein YaaA (DUF328/UPF0246 family)